MQFTAHLWIWIAMNGKEEEGRYYFANHGNYREVSRLTYQFCLWQECAEVTSACLMLSDIGRLSTQSSTS